MKGWAVLVATLLTPLFLVSCLGQGSGSGDEPGGDGPPDGSSNCDPIPPDAATTRIAAVGDTGTGTDEQMSVAALIEAGDAEADFDALVLLGDLVYEEGDAALVDERVLDPYANTLDGTTDLVPMIGNHDVRMGMEEDILDQLGASGRWYSHREGPVLIIVLDTTEHDDPDQIAWVTAELEAADDRWIVAAMHHPMYSAGFHGSSRDVRDTYKDLFETHGVDLVLAGHDHDYQRQEIVSNITYIVSGGGAKLRDAGNASFTVVSTSRLHYLELVFSEDVLEARAHGLTEQIDAFTVCHPESNLR